MSGALKLAVGFMLAAVVLLYVEAVLAVLPSPVWTGLLLLPVVLLAALVFDSVRRRRSFTRRFHLGALTRPLRAPTPAAPAPAVQAPDPPAPSEAARLAAAAEHFNATTFPRTVAGIAKTLGPPHASVVPLSETTDEVVVTVAWELSWYQYHVASVSAEPVRLERRGQELEELDDRFQDWNAQVDAEGRLHLES